MALKHQKGAHMTAILVHLSQELGSDRLQFYAPHVWLYKGECDTVIIKLEQTKTQDKLLVNASFARDGSGPLMASFMSMLLIEDCHATSMDTFGVCSGKASITLYHLLDMTGFDAVRLSAYLQNFETLVLCVLEGARANMPNIQDDRLSLIAP